jgi:glycosyltransferase involved in cell wall biosynthesis
MKLSVITPTHNPRLDNFEPVLAALRAQRLPGSDWEYIVVDNCSAEPVSQSIDVSWHPQAQIVVQPKLGLTPARLRGFQVARGDVIVLVDDDCVLPPDYLRKVLELLERYPHIGVLGAAVLTGRFEKQPEEWMKPFCGYLCANQFAPPQPLPIQYALARKHEGCTPAGAGMIIRRDVVQEYQQQLEADPFRAGLDRTGGALIGSGDMDIGCTAIDMGLATGLARELALEHLIPAGRVEKNYLKRLLYASQYGTARLLIHRGWREPIAPKRNTWVQRCRSALRQALRPPSPEWECWVAYGKGYQDGMSGAEYDEAYR